jgi:glycosyltransferase involved in cell wall biosynthesis
MKICIISSQFGAPWAGSELLWWKAAHAALDEGHEVAVVYKRWEEMPARLLDLRARGATLFLRGVDLGRHSSRAFEQLVHPLPAIARWRPDVVCVNLGNFTDAMTRGDIHRFVAKIRAPYVVIIHQHCENNWVVPDDYSRQCMVRFFAAADRVAFVSERSRWAATCQLATELPNACVVRNPIGDVACDPVAWPGPGAARFACVSRLDASDKGQDLLLAALADGRWRSRDWALRLYGEGRHRGYLEELAHHYGIADRVEFRGHVSDVRGIWDDNHLLVLPSRCEGTPIALIEAMIWGRPSVVTDVGGNTEWISEPRNGFVAEAASLKSYAAALERAWEARDLWPTIGANAHDDALALYDPSPESTLLRMLVEAGDRPGMAARPPRATTGA